MTKLAREVLNCRALVIMEATFVRYGSTIAFLVKEFVNSSDTLSPKGFFLPEVALVIPEGPVPATVALTPWYEEVY